MTATTVLCVLSTLSFCLCARGLMLVMPSLSGPLRRNPGGFSARARRLARGYIVVSLTVLAMASLVSAVKSYLELFS